MTKIIVNGREVEADPKKPLIAACHAEGVEVPHYCYHPGLTPVGSCRMCQVEVQQGEMPARVVASCRTPVAEGMVVNTESERAHETRRECLEFLLKNHPLDCPICDKAGECMLQDYTFDEGQAAARTDEPRRELEKRKDLGDTIVLDQERCILCSRCVRFFEEVTEKPQLAITERGAHSVLETFMDRPLEGNYQGNIADLCPVGALTLKPFRFKARVWNLFKKSSTCAECSRGCSITTEVLRGGEVKRFRPRYNADVNTWWMCDTGRFAFGHVNREGRLAGAERRGYSEVEAVDVDEALAQVADALSSARASDAGAPVVVASPFLTVEEGRALLELCAALGAEARFVSPAPNELKDDLLHTGDPCPNRRGLTDLGFAPVEPAAALEAIAGAEVALAVGERVGELLGDEGLAALPTTVRLFAFDTVACHARAAQLSVGVPDHTERMGTWVNVDGHEGRISVARKAPDGVRMLTSNLDTLRTSLRGAEVSAR